MNDNKKEKVKKVAAAFTKNRDQPKRLRVRALMNALNEIEKDKPTPKEK